MIGTDRRDRRRARRPGRGLHAGGARLRGRAVREEPLARRQGGRAERGRLPLRHGADDPPDALGPAADLRRGRPRPRGRARPGPARPPVAVASSTTARRSTCTPTSTRWPRRSTRSPRAAASAGLSRGSSTSPKRLDDISERYFFWRSIGSLRDMFDPTTAFSLSTLGDVLAHAALEHGRRRRSAATSPTRASPRCSTTSRSTSARRPTLSPAVLCGIAHMQTGEGVWYPRGGTRAVPEALDPTGRASWASSSRPSAACDRILTDGRRPCRGRRDSTTARRVAAGGRRLELRLRPHPPRAARRHARPRRGSNAAAATSRPARASCCTWASTAATSTCSTTTSSSRATRTRSSTSSTARASRPPTRPATSAPRPHRARGRPAGRRGALRPGPHAVPAAAPRLEAMLPELPPRRSSTSSKTTGRAAGHRERIKFERRLTPQDIHDRYRVLDGAIYGLASHGRFTARSSRPTAARTCRGSTWPAARPIPGPGMPMVLMSGWIAADALDQDGVRRSSPDRSDARPLTVHDATAIS